jgi:hypothetical protein
MSSELVSRVIFTVQCATTTNLVRATQNRKFRIKIDNAEVDETRENLVMARVFRHKRPRSGEYRNPHNDRHSQCQHESIRMPDNPRQGGARLVNPVTSMARVMTPNHSPVCHSTTSGNRMCSSDRCDRGVSRKPVASSYRRSVSSASGTEGFRVASNSTQHTARKSVVAR